MEKTKKKRRIRRVLATLLAFTMIFACMPGMAWASETEDKTETCNVTINFDVSSFGTDEVRPN